MVVNGVMARAAPARSRKAAQTPSHEGMVKAWDKLRVTLTHYRDQDAADKVRRDMTVILTAVEREAARYIGYPDGMPDDWVFRILQEEEAGEYEMRME